MQVVPVNPVILAAKHGQLSTVRMLLDVGAGTVEDRDEVKCVCVPSTPIPGLCSHWTVHSFIREFGGASSYNRMGRQHCCGHLTEVTCHW